MQDKYGQEMGMPPLKPKTVDRISSENTKSSTASCPSQSRGKYHEWELEQINGEHIEWGQIYKNHNRGTMNP